MAEAPINVLLVEDDEFLTDMYSAKLQIANFNVSTAANGKLGLEAMRKSKPDIILLDILMPEMNGFEVLKEMKSDDALKNIPVLLLTNLGQRSDIDRGMELGADGYLIKVHFTPDEVIEKIKETLAKKKA